MKVNKKIYVGSVVETKECGLAEIVEVIGGKHVRVKFIDTGKHTHIFQRGHFSLGGIRDPYRPAKYGVGYIGVGVYTKIWTKEVKQAHRIWTDVLRRSYDEVFHKKYPTYEDCTVCDEWLNFQNFADWYLNHESYGLGYDLDKDLLVRGNKKYSPETCCMLPSEINATIQEGVLKDRGLPRGVYKHAGGGYFARLVAGEKGTIYDRFDNVEEAEIFYKKQKREDLTRKAEKWKYLVTIDVYESLKAWEV